MVGTGITIAVAIIALIGMAVAGACEAQGRGIRVSEAREVKHWLRGAATLSIIGAVPAFIARPNPEFPAAIYDTVDGLTALFVVLGLACLGASIYRLVPAWRRYQGEREEEQRRRQIAAAGGPYPQISSEMAESLNQCLPELTVQADQHSDDGNHANAVVDSEAEGQRYVIYALPLEHLLLDKGKRLNPNALRRASAAAASFAGRPILWAPSHPERGAQGYYAEHKGEPRPYVVEGKDVHLAEAIRKFELAARSERRRREARQAERDAQKSDPRHHQPIRGQASADHARRQHDRETWERFNLLSPRHPQIIDEIERRTRRVCDSCLNVIAEGDGKVVVTDHDHVCRNDASVRLALDEGSQAITQHMPDCGQCHYETPDLYESCVSRLTLVHPGKCPPSPYDAEEVERQAEHEQRERLAALGQSMGNQ